MAWTEYFVDLSAGVNGTGTSGSPWNSWANAVSGLTTAFGGTTATGPTLVHVKGNATLSGNATMNLDGTAANPICWKGYVTTTGDLDILSSEPANRPATNCQGNVFDASGGDYQQFVNLAFTGTRGGNTVTMTTTSRAVNCSFESTATSANGVACGTLGLAVNCLFKANAASANANYGWSGAAGVFLGCTFDGAKTQLLAATSYIAAVGCIFRNGAGKGIYHNSANGLLISGCTFDAITGNAIEINAQPTTGFGIVANVAGRNCGALLVCNSTMNLMTGKLRYYNCGATPISGVVEGTGWPFALDNAAESSDPFVNAANGDYDLVAAALARHAALPLYFPGLASTANYLSCGAAQPYPASHPLIGPGLLIS